MRPRRKIEWETWLYRRILVTYAILLGIAIVPRMGIIVRVPFRSVGLIWLYAGVLPVAAVAVTVVIRAARREAAALPALLSAYRQSVVAFGALGLALWFIAMSVPRHKPFTVGYWIHAQLWLDAAEVREWAARQPANGEQGIPAERWPASLRRVALGRGVVQIDSATRRLSLVKGFAAAHYGLEIAAAGAPAAPPAGYALRVRSNAWVWHAEP
jgi:hypothetical protein